VVGESRDGGGGGASSSPAEAAYLALDLEQEHATASSARDLMVTAMARLPPLLLSATVQGRLEMRGGRGAGAEVEVPLLPCTQCCADTEVEVPDAPRSSLLWPGAAAAASFLPCSLCRGSTPTTLALRLRPPADGPSPLPAGALDHGALRPADNTFSHPGPAAKMEAAASREHAPSFLWRRWRRRRPRFLCLHARANYRV
jgi:hypothetical protein